MEIQIKIKVLFLGHESISVSCVGNFFERALCWEISERVLCWEFFLGGRVVLTLGGMGCTNADLSPKISRHKNSVPSGQKSPNLYICDLRLLWFIFEFIRWGHNKSNMCYFLGPGPVSVACVGKFSERCLCWEILERGLCWEIFQSVPPMVGTTLTPI